MPPKPKFTREEIIDAAFEIVRAEGMNALTARELGKKLGSSARPIFTMFKDMNELKSEITIKANDLLKEYVSRAENYTPVFKQAVKETILFASEEPNLFQLIFLSNNTEPENFEFLKVKFKDETEDLLEVIKNNYGLNTQQAMIAIKHTIIYIYGIGAMCAAKVCTFTDEQLNVILGEVFNGMLYYIKSGRINDEIIIPVEVNGNKEG